MQLNLTKCRFLLLFFSIQAVNRYILRAEKYFFRALKCLLRTTFNSHKNHVCCAEVTAKIILVTFARKIRILGKISAPLKYTGKRFFAKTGGGGSTHVFKIFIFWNFDPKKTNSGLLETYFSSHPKNCGPNMCSLDFIQIE